MIQRACEGTAGGQGLSHSHLCVSSGSGTTPNTHLWESEEAWEAQSQHREEVGCLRIPKSLLREATPNLTQPGLGQFQVQGQVTSDEEGSSLEPSLFIKESPAGPPALQTPRWSVPTKAPGCGIGWWQRWSLRSRFKIGPWSAGAVGVGVRSFPASVSFLKEGAGSGQPWRCAAGPRSSG